MTYFTIPPEIIDCIKEGRAPNMLEVRKVADHIWSDIKGFGRAGAEDAAARNIAVRAAKMALTGCATI